MQVVVCLSVSSGEGACVSIGTSSVWRTDDALFPCYSQRRNEMSPRGGVLPPLRGLSTHPSASCAGSVAVFATPIASARRNLQEGNACT